MTKTTSEKFIELTIDLFEEVPDVKKEEEKKEERVVVIDLTEDDDFSIDI